MSSRAHTFHLMQASRAGGTLLGSSSPPHARAAS
jgi:hypothetical protein